MSDRAVVDLIPLEAVLFPYERLPLRISDPTHLSMIRENLIYHRPLGIALIEEGEEFGPPPIPYDIGTLVRIRRWDRKSRGYTMLLEGERRFRITRLLQEVPYIRVEVEYLDSPRPRFPGDYQKLRSTLASILSRLTLDTPPLGRSPSPSSGLPRRKERLLGLAGVMLSGFPEEKQEVLEEESDQMVARLTDLLYETLGGGQREETEPDGGENA